jgi:DNA-binding NtrC family response regulator
MAFDLTVLIVDDDPVCLRLLDAVLGELGYRVTTTEHPQEALRLALTDPPDILMADLRMPAMSGVDLVRAVRHLGGETCCLVITGFASSEATAEAYRAGATDLLLKPINVPEVQARVQNVAELVRLRREVRQLRATQGSANQTEDGAERSAPRTRELATLPALPGSGRPLDVRGRDEILPRLEHLGVLYRHGAITRVEYEEKKRALLARV